MGSKCSGNNSNDYDDHVPTSREINLAIVASEEYQIKPRLIEDLIKQDSNQCEPLNQLSNIQGTDNLDQHSQKINLLQQNGLKITQNSQNNQQINTNGILKKSTERRSRSTNCVHFDLQQLQKNVTTPRRQHKNMDQKNSVLRINLLFQESECKQFNIQNI